MLEMSSKEEENLPLDATNVCVRHAEDYVVYCRKCSELLCCSCMVDNCHKEHSQMTCSLETLFSEMQSTIQEQGHSAQEKEMATQAIVKNMEDRRDQVCKNFGYMCREIEAFFAGVEQLVDGHEAHISDAIKRSKEDEIQKMQLKEREIVEQIQKCEEFSSTAKSFLQRLSDNDISVLAEVDQVLMNLDQLESEAKTLDSEPPKSFKQPSMVNVDLAATEEKVKQIVDKLGGCQAPSLQVPQQNSGQPEHVMKKKPLANRISHLPASESNLDTLVVSLRNTRARSAESHYDIPQGIRNGKEQVQRPFSCTDGEQPMISLPYLAIPETIISCPGCDPYSVCITKNGNIAVSDKKSGSIYLYKQDGKCLKKAMKKKEVCAQYLAFYAGKQKIIAVGLSSEGSCQMLKYKAEFGKAVPLPNVAHPGGLTIACDPRPIIVVTDHHKGSIYKFSTDGQFQSEIDTTECDVVAEPRGIDYAHGNMLVVDQGRHCVVKLSMAGTTQWKAGRCGSGDGCLSHPFDVAVAGNGHVVVTDTDNNRVVVFDRKGKFVVCFGRMGTGPGMFIDPYGIAITEDDSIIVADSGNHRLQIFSLTAVLQKNM